MSFIVYPSTLPAPAEVALEPTPRGPASPGGPGPWARGNLQREIVATGALRWTLSGDEWLAWHAWWAGSEAVQGGAEFVVDWPMPWGGGALVAFAGEPQVSMRGPMARTVQVPVVLRERPPMGPLGIFVMNTTDRNTNQISKAYLSGYTLRVRWNKIEIGPDTYDWALIDQILQRCQARRQRVTLELFARDVPAHVMADLSEDTWADHRGFVTCVPWDANAVAAWEAFVAVLAAHPTPTASGGGPVALADHPALYVVDAPLVGIQSVRDVLQTLVARPDYDRATFVNSCVAAVQVIEDHFPKQYKWIGVFPMFDSGGTYRVDEDVVDAVLEEFIPEPALDPKVGFFQELLADANPETQFIGTPMLRARARTWVAFQALTNWATPWTGADKVASGDPAVGLAYAYATYACRYAELYAKDVQNADNDANLTTWAAILTSGRHPLAPSPLPLVTVLQPTETALIAGTAAQLGAQVLVGSTGAAIVSVAFYVRGTLVHTDTISPWGYLLNTVLLADGPCLIEARATDALGNVGSGYRNAIIQNGTTAPYVEILGPDDGATVSGLVAIDVYAVDLGSVAKVEFFVDGVLKQTRLTSPYGYSWPSTSVADGEHEISVTATDDDDETTTVEITVYVANTA